MNKLLSTVAALAVVFTAATASAATEHGTIDSINAMSHRITLEDGSTYRLAEGVSMKDLQPGLEVQVTYEMDSNGHAIATAVEPDEERHDLIR